MYKHLILHEKSNNTIIPNCDQGMKALAVIVWSQVLVVGALHLQQCSGETARLKACHLFPVTVINQAKLFSLSD